MIHLNMNEKIDIGPYNRGELCPYCDSPALEVTEYSVRVSMGSLANKQLRELRKKCHKLFDAQWKGKPNEKLVRRKCYVWLQGFTHLPEELAHIGMFNVEQCETLIAELTKNNHSKT